MLSVLWLWVHCVHFKHFFVNIYYYITLIREGTRAMQEGRAVRVTIHNELIIITFVIDIYKLSVKAPY